MNTVIHYENEGFSTAHSKPMGRHFASYGFLSAYARHSRAQSFKALVSRRELGEEFVRLMFGFREDVPARYILRHQMQGLREIGCLYLPAPPSSQQAWLRHLHGPRSWSICGVNHTLASARVMDEIASWLTAPIQPWDAMVCTSRASREVVLRILASQTSFLAGRLGATRFIEPQLPIIPLGVNCDAFEIRPGERASARTGLNIGPDDVVVLFVGRLSIHAKANPAPMYLALERLAAHHRMVLIECGWAATDTISRVMAAGRAQMCPSVRSVVLDGRRADERKSAWAAADIFCSLSDNIQESFGLTPIEAMATGLPAVVTDWDGYRDTVRNGVDGFTVPTLSAPPGSGLEIARAYALEHDDYNHYITQVSLSTMVDIDAAAAALASLAKDPDLRRRMGTAGAKRARETFDWRVIVRAYEELWEHLAALRQTQDAPTSSQSGNADWPARPDPFSLFANFPSATLSGGAGVSLQVSLGTAEIEARLGIELTLMSAARGMTTALLVELCRLAGRPDATVDSIAAAKSDVPRSSVVRALLFLGKFGLVTFSRTSRATLGTS